MKKIRKKIAVFDVVVMVIMVYIVIVTLYPFINVVALSFNDSNDTVKGGIYLWPRVFTLGNYKEIFSNPNLPLVRAGFNSVLRTVVGTFFTVISCCMLAYTLSRRDYVLRKFVSMVFVVTMYVGGGMIPSYLLMKNLHLLGSFWVYILPGLIGYFNVIVIRSFMDSLPPSLQESARLDGANDFVIFSKIVLPLCIPVIATVALWTAVGQWNSWFDTYLYGKDLLSMTNLQYELKKILDSTQATSGQTQTALARNGSLIINPVSSDSIKMAITIIVTVPILLVYPFVQKYFITGMTLGAVKG